MRAGGLSERTVQTRTSQIRTLCRAVGEDDPAAITTGQLIDWLSVCVSPWTRRTYWSSARAWCDWLIRMGLREDDPSALLPAPKMPRGTPRPVAWAVIEKMLAEPASVRSYSYVALAAYTGLRVHEIAKFRGEDVDVEVGWLFVDGKGARRAALPLHPVIARLAIGMDPVGYWFPGACGGHVRPQAVSRTIRAALERVGSHASAHALRHAFGSQVLRNSHDIRVTQLLLRHQSLSSTQVYTEVSDADMVAAVNALPAAS